MESIVGRAFGIQSLRSRVRSDAGHEPRDSAAPTRGGDASGRTTEHPRAERSAC